MYLIAMNFPCDHQCLTYQTFHIVLVLYYDNSIVYYLRILLFQRRHRRVLAESQHQYNHTGLSLPKVSMNPSFHTSSFGNHYNAHNPSASTVSLLPSLSSTYKAPKVPHSTAQVPHSTALVITAAQ